VQEQGLLWRELMDCPELWNAAKIHCTPRCRGLAAALLQAIDLYHRDACAYGRMLANLHDQAVRFSWRGSAEEYS